jgi:hypothetical protein
VWELEDEYLPHGRTTLIYDPSSDLADLAREARAEAHAS